MILPRKGWFNGTFLLLSYSRGPEARYQARAHKHAFLHTMRSCLLQRGLLPAWSSSFSLSCWEALWAGQIEGQQINDLRHACQRNALHDVHWYLHDTGARVVISLLLWQAGPCIGRQLVWNIQLCDTWAYVWSNSLLFFFQAFGPWE